MKNILQTLLLFSMLFSVNTYSLEADKKMNDCFVSNPKDHSTTLDEIKECVDEELDKDTEASIALRKAQTPVDAVELTSQIKNIISLLTFVILGFTFFNMYHGLSSRNLEQQAKNKADYMFKTLFVASLLSIIVMPQLFSYATKTILNGLYGQPIIFYTAMNVQKSQSETVKKHAVSNSRTEISEKVLSISRFAIQQQTCAVGYHQEMISAYAKEDIQFIQENKEIDCVDKFLKNKSGSSLKQLDNRLLLPAAVFECSSKHNGLIKDCGSINTKSSIKELNVLVDKYANQIADFVNDYAGYVCNKSYIENRQNYEAYCTTIKDSQKTVLTTDKTLLDIEDSFFLINKNFINDFGLALVSGINLPKKYESQINLLDMYGNMNTFLLTDKYDKRYQTVAKKEIQSISGSIGFSKNKHNGSLTKKVDSVEMIMENAEDFMFYVKRQADSLFDSPVIMKNAVMEDFAFIKDVKLLFGEYTDGTGEQDFKVSFIPLQIIQDNRNKTLAIATMLTIGAKYVKRQADLKGEEANKAEMIETLAMVLFGIAFFPELFSLFVIVFTVGGITIKMLEAVCMAAIEIFLILVVKKEPHLLMNRLTQLFIGMVIKPIVPVFGLAAGSLFAVIALEMMKNIPLINDNYGITFVFGVIIQCLMIMYLIRKTVWVSSYLHKSLKTDISGFKGDIKKSFKDATNIVK